MFLAHAKVGGEVLEVPAQKVVRGPVLNIAPRKLNGKTKHMHCSSCLSRVFKALKSARNWQILEPGTSCLMYKNLFASTL